LKLIGHVRGGFLELLNALAKTFGKFRDFLGANEHQNGDHDNHKLPAA